MSPGKPTRPQLSRPSPRSAQDLLHLAPALDEGRGTAYERHALDRFLEQLLRRLAPSRVLEMPANGVMGVPGIKSLVLAAHGVDLTLAVPDATVADDIRSVWDAVGLPVSLQVTAYDDSGFPAGHFDLVWNFCVLEHAPDPQALLNEMVRVSRRFVLLLTQNPINLGYPVHRMVHWLRRERWDHGDIGHATLRAVTAGLTRAGATVIETGGVDMPPWPDINMRLRDPADAVPERYPEAYGHLRPAVRRRPISEIADRLRRGPRTRGFWPNLYRTWNRVEQILPRRILAWTSHHPFVLARVDRPPS